MNPLLWLLSIGHLVVDLGHGILPLLTPLFAQNFHLSYFQVGTIVLSFTVSSAIIQPVFGVLSDRFRMPWLMPLGLLLSGVGLALSGIVKSYELLLLAVFLSGIGVAAYHPEASKFVHLISEDRKAGSSMAVFSLGGNLGFGLGPMFATIVIGFGGLSSIGGVMIPGLLSALVFFWLLPRFKNTLAEDLHNQVENKAQSSPGKNQVGVLILLILYVMIRSWIQSGIIYFIPFYFPNFRGIAEPEYLVSIFLIAGAAGTLLGGPFADRFGGRKGLLFSMVLCLFTAYPFLHLNGPLVPILAFIFGASLISTFSTTVVFGQRLLPNNIGLASGLMLGFGVGTGSIGVTFLGGIADHYGLPFTMNLISLLPLLGIILAFTLPNIKAQA